MTTPPEDDRKNEPQSDSGAKHNDDRYGYALWKYGEFGWKLVKDCSVEGCVNGGPPQLAGLFHGQILATPSVAA